jgi:hypothetical protein
VYVFRMCVEGFTFFVLVLFGTLMEGQKLCLSLGIKAWRERAAPSPHPLPLLTTANGLAPLGLGAA